MLGESTFSLLRATHHCASLPCVLTGFSVIFIGAFHGAVRPHKPYGLLVGTGEEWNWE